MNNLFAASFCIGLLTLNAPAAFASPITLHVDVNTAPLVDSLSGPFSIDFQLTDGSGTLAVPNTATLSNFTFGGGSVGDTANLFGGVTGDLGSSVVLTDGGDFLSEFFQSFSPGSSFGFDLMLTRNVDPGSTPDAFSFAILDGSLANIPTTGLGDSLLLINIDSTSLGLADVRTSISTSPAGVGVTASEVPEPASLLLVGVGLLGLRLIRRGNG